jgi:DNA-binding GntR family transcriptional regulator
MKKVAVLLLLLSIVAMPLAASLHTDATRLASILADTQDKASISPAAWKTIANEALTYAGRLYLHRTPKVSDDVKAARKHVLEMHDAAEKGDADGAKSHAALALPYVYKVIDATAPKK